MSNNNRLLSLDALRGFDMFFIIGGAGLIASLCNLFPASDVASWLSAQMHHVDWDGFAHHDTIFPSRYASSNSPEPPKGTSV